MKKLTEEERKKRDKDSRRKYQLENKDKIKEIHRLYYLKNKDKFKDINRQYYLENKDYNRQHYLKNKDKVREYNRKYLLENKDKAIIPIEPMTVTKREIEALEAQIARLKSKPLEELIYKRA